MKKITFLVFSILCLNISANCQTQASWLRYPSISPDGSKVAFGYKGDIYIVATNGGVATPLTIHEAHDMMPIWSNDGKTIAFASDRFGNFDVFSMPVSGGNPTRLTFHSANDYPYDFSADDKKIIFGSGRLVSDKNIRFYSPRLFQNLYSVGTNGGKSILISQAAVECAHYNSKGNAIVYQDRKGYEDPWRKHHTSSVTRDIWLLNLQNNNYTQLSNFEGEDREPVFSNDDKDIFYLSEKENSTQNIFQYNIESKSEKAVTNFKNHPIRHLSVSQKNDLCFSYKGDIYLMAKDKSPSKLNVQIQNDGRSNTEKNVSINSNVSEFSVSPNGKEIAFVTRGEVFVTSVEGGVTKRITNTPQQERSVSWTPDGRKLFYAAERNDNWDIYSSNIVRKEESYFYSSTVLNEETVINSEKEEFQPVVSPDGKEIAYFENRNILKVYNIATKSSKVIIPEGRNYSYADGDHNIVWSPDGKWILADDDLRTWGGNHAAMIKADGSQTLYPAMSGFNEYNGKFNLNGNLITYENFKDGRRSLANQGNRELDVYGVFLNQEMFDKFKLSKEDFALLKEKEDADKKADTSKIKKPETKVFNPEFKGTEDRKIRLTIHSSSISDYVLNNDASKLFYIAAFEKGFDLWVTDTRTKETKILAKLGSTSSSLEISNDGKNLFLTNNGSLVKVETESGKMSPVGINGEMILNSTQERAYIFTHAWRQVKEKFYDTKIHGIDWKMYKETYSSFLPHINNNYDFQELLSELLGELNGSHTGGRFSPQPINPDLTASLGLIYDESLESKGLKITEIITGGPFDKANTKIKAGQTIVKIDGEDLTTENDWAKLLNRKNGKLTLIETINESGAKIEESVKPITINEENGLMYKRWLTKMKNLVEKLSNGQVGYVHVQGMNDGSYRQVFDELMGYNFSKKAVIVDTRFNGGGWLHDDLFTLLNGKRYLDFAPQGNKLNDAEPLGKWQKPSCVLMSEGNYSDAFIFPYIYKANGVGKLIGTAVPGTGTAVWWETQIDPTIVFGIPMVATIGKEGRPTENLQVEPDIKVLLPYNEFINGKDAQIEAAVAELLKTIK
jgi:tricorn protease